MALIFLVPPGIGDFSAMYQKLSPLGKEREIIIRPACDPPERLAPFLDCLPNVKNGGPSSHTAMSAIYNTLPPNTDLEGIKDGVYFLSINTFLEEGGHVVDWMPGPTEYKYAFKEMPELTNPVAGMFEELNPKRPYIGVYCSAYGNSRHWGFWGPAEWMEFLKEVRKHVPSQSTFIFIGAEYDLQISDVLYDWMQKEGIPSMYTVGSFHIRGTIELIRGLDYFFSFPSGLGFLADVVGTPNLMWFPEHLAPMMGSFCYPPQFLSGQTSHDFFATPKDAAQGWVILGGPQHLEKRRCQNTLSMS